MTRYKGWTDVNFVEFPIGRFIRYANEIQRTSKWMEVKSMDGMCDPVDKRREECAVKEAQKERKVGADYMRQRHGLVESREPAYRPVGGKKKGKY